MADSEAPDPEKGKGKGRGKGKGKEKAPAEPKAPSKIPDPRKKYPKNPKWCPSLLDQYRKLQTVIFTTADVYGPARESLDRKRSAEREIKEEDEKISRARDKLLLHRLAKSGHKSRAHLGPTEGRPYSEMAEEERELLKGRENTAEYRSVSWMLTDVSTKVWGHEEIKTLYFTNAELQLMIYDILGGAIAAGFEKDPLPTASLSTTHFSRTPPTMFVKAFAQHPQAPNGVEWVYHWKMGKKKERVIAKSATMWDGMRGGYYFYNQGSFHMSALPEGIYDVEGWDPDAPLEHQAKEERYLQPENNITFYKEAAGQDSISGAEMEYQERLRKAREEEEAGKEREAGEEEEEEEVVLAETVFSIVDITDSPHPPPPGAGAAGAPGAPGPSALPPSEQQPPREQPPPSSDPKSAPPSGQARPGPAIPAALMSPPALKKPHEIKQEPPSPRATPTPRPSPAAEPGARPRPSPTPAPFVSPPKKGPAHPISSSSSSTPSPPVIRPPPSLVVPIPGLGLTTLTLEHTPSRGEKRKVQEEHPKQPSPQYLGPSEDDIPMAPDSPEDVSAGETKSPLKVDPTQVSKGLQKLREEMARKAQIEQLKKKAQEAREKAAQTPKVSLLQRPYQPSPSMTPSPMPSPAKQFPPSQELFSGLVRIPTPSPQRKRTAPRPPKKPLVPRGVQYDDSSFEADWEPPPMSSMVRKPEPEPEVEEVIEVEEVQPATPRVWHEWQSPEPYRSTQEQEQINKQVAAEHEAWLKQKEEAKRARKAEKLEQRKKQKKEERAEKKRQWEEDRKKQEEKKKQRLVKAAFEKKLIDEAKKEAEKEMRAMEKEIDKIEKEYLKQEKERKKREAEEARKKEQEQALIEQAEKDRLLFLEKEWEQREKQKQEDEEARAAAEKKEEKKRRAEAEAGEQRRREEEEKRRAEEEEEGEDDEGLLDEGDEDLLLAGSSPSDASSDWSLSDFEGDDDGEKETPEERKRRRLRQPLAASGKEFAVNINETSSSSSEDEFLKNRISPEPPFASKKRPSKKGGERPQVGRQKPSSRLKMPARRERSEAVFSEELFIAEPPEICPTQTRDLPNMYCMIICGSPVAVNNFTQRKAQSAFVYTLPGGQMSENLNKEQRRRLEEQRTGQPCDDPDPKKAYSDLRYKCYVVPYRKTFKHLIKNAYRFKKTNDSFGFWTGWLAHFYWE